MEQTANTVNYMIAGYAVFAIVMGAYLASLFMRARSLKQDMALLEELGEKDSDNS